MRDSPAFWCPNIVAVSKLSAGDELLLTGTGSGGGMTETVE